MAREAGGRLTHPAVRIEKAVPAPADMVRGRVIRQNPAAEAHGQHMQEMGPEPGSNLGALWLQTKKGRQVNDSRGGMATNCSNPQRGEDGAGSQVARARD